MSLGLFASLGTMAVRRDDGRDSLGAKITQKRRALRYPRDHFNPSSRENYFFEKKGAKMWQELQIGDGGVVRKVARGGES